MIDTYTDEHIATAFHDALAEHAKHATMTAEQKRRSPLRVSTFLIAVVALFTNLFFGRQHFGNYDHVDPNTEIPGDHGTKPFPKGKSGADSNMMEYPLPNLHNPKSSGPARIILHNKGGLGELKYGGVVSHDQSRGAKHAGVSDHFRIARQG